MAHYAFLDDNNIVTEVITGRGEDEVVDGISNWEMYYGSIRNQRCLRTSYNTRGNTHTLGGVPFRYNYAEVGGYYDEERDGFVGVKRFPSFVLDETTLTWVAPIPYPTDGIDYVWVEAEMRWVPVDEYFLHVVTTSNAESE